MAYGQVLELPVKFVVFALALRCFFARDYVIAFKPPTKVNFTTAVAAKGVVFLGGGLFANGAFVIVIGGFHDRSIFNREWVRS